MPDSALDRRAEPGVLGRAECREPRTENPSTQEPKNRRTEEPRFQTLLTSSGETEFKY